MLNFINKMCQIILCYRHMKKQSVIWYR